MEAATKKKRGRPKDQEYESAMRLNIVNKAYSPCLSDRTLQNAFNADEYMATLLESDRPDLEEFFETKEGNAKHRGIAEQMGRMIRGGLITDEQAIWITEQVVESYKRGATSKQIEKFLRQKRIEMMREKRKDH